MEPAHLTPRDGVHSALELTIRRDLHPNAEGISTADAAWPRRLRRIMRASLQHWGLHNLTEPAELLLTELATNALRHGKGREVKVRVLLRGARCVIEVADGSPTRPEPRHAALDDEGGRGLLLVESLAAEWGVSQDGTTTWCTLPLTKGDNPMPSAAATAPVLREIPIDLPPDLNAPGLARIQARSLLTVLDWPGDQHFAADVLHVLVDNAVQHTPTGTETRPTFGARLHVTEAHELLVDVTDAVPQFPDFDQAIGGEGNRSLTEITSKGVELSWFLVGNDYRAKTVRAVLRPGPVPL
ncbi:ATP-binding protein [Streptomyces sp. NPDC003635]